MDIDLTKLNAGLEELTGKDLEKLEKIARSQGETSPEITLSKTYQALVAAKALGMKYDDIRDLPAKKYLQVTMTVFNFFFGDMVPGAAAEAGTTALQSITEE